MPKKGSAEKEIATYFGSVEPNQIERIEIERRVRTIKNRPSSKLSRREARDYNTGKLGVIEFGGFAGITSGNGEKREENGEAEKRFVRHYGSDRERVCVTRMKM